VRKLRNRRFFNLSPINAKNLGKSSKRSREILWEIVGQTLENRFLDRFCQVRPERIADFRCSIAVSLRKQLLILFEKPIGNQQLALGNQLGSVD